MSKASPLKAGLQLVARAMLLDGPRPRTFFDSPPILSRCRHRTRLSGGAPIHMSPPTGIRRTFRLLVGKRVVVRGRPSIAFTAHHHARIVMHVTQINAR